MHFNDYGSILGLLTAAVTIVVSLIYPLRSDDIGSASSSRPASPCDCCNSSKEACGVIALSVEEGKSKKEKKRYLLSARTRDMLLNVLATVLVIVTSVVIFIFR
jgi:hypothetical protein